MCFLSGSGLGYRGAVGKMTENVFKRDIFRKASPHTSLSVDHPKQCQSLKWLTAAWKSNELILNLVVGLPFLSGLKGLNDMSLTLVFLALITREKLE